MHAVMRSDGAAVLTIEQFELASVEDVLSLLEDCARDSASDDSLDDDEQQEFGRLAALLEKLSTALGHAEGRLVATAAPPTPGS